MGFGDDDFEDRLGDSYDKLRDCERKLRDLLRDSEDPAVRAEVAEFDAMDAMEHEWDMGRISEEEYRRERIGLTMKLRKRLREDGDI